VVTVRTRRRESTVVMTVSDTGVGMSEEDLARIFDPFFSTKGEGGLGLGLTVAYATIAAHGGSISVKSEKGKGTTFHISLPAISTVQDEPADAAAEPAGPMRILVADDETHVRSALIDALRADGHQVTECASGQEAVALLRQETFDLVLTDLGMPGVTGWDVAKAARASGNGPAVVLLTGWGDSITSEKLSRHGVQAVLAKPCRFAELRRVLAKVTA
ncbi:MAG: response regulator, partial [Armatimonadota bacterium]